MSAAIFILRASRGASMKEGRGEDDLMRHGESWTVRLMGRLFEQQLHDAMIWDSWISRD